VDVHVPPAPGALGHVSEIPLLLAASGAQVVALCGYLTDKQFQEVVDAALAGGCQVLAVPRAAEVAGVHPNTVWRHGQPLVELTAPSLKGWQLLVKRVVDLVGATAGLVVAAPIMIIVAVLIKLGSPGPVVFAQERVGAGGRRFRVRKFRTMRDGASPEPHRRLVQQMLKGDETSTGHRGKSGEQVFKLVNDDRVTSLGRWLRRTSLDELPQLFNVVRGEMSLVGPRPPLEYEMEVYDHWQLDRLQVKPGITGLWQVSGRNRLTYRRMCELDVEYVRQWSLWLDIKILFRTIPVVFFNSGRAA
jgi:exopolysaccharide biosynthesis polyprenyl glycosylphosphotransferase